MKDYILYYAKTDLDVPCFTFKKHSEMIDFIDEKCIGRNGQVVWLLAKEESTDVFVSESHLSIQDFLLSKYLWKTKGTYYLQEYPSFEDAYSVALGMAEISKLCYSDEPI
jgi:hypothetical protein